MTGHFVTLEGGEGAGKSTQARKLAEWLREQGEEVVETREPGGTPGADAIRALILDPDTPLSALSEAYLFAAARADHVENVIAPAIGDGKWVVCDRFIDSSLAYQGAAGGLGVERVRAINADAIGDHMPDLTILLATDVDTGTRRAAQRDGEQDDRFSVRDAQFHEKVAQAFAELAEAEPDRFAVIDSSQPIDDVARQIRAAVRERLL